ncbi:hypothetical protein GJ496_003937 [Pomphorhynchus laevis]|nr:hypothetical protein GJ496_003937 [Pomphorhynchus laevis]
MNVTFFSICFCRSSALENINLSHANLAASNSVSLCIYYPSFRSHIEFEYKMINLFATESKDVAYLYTIYNPNTNWDVENVHIEDNSFESEYFNLISGSTTAEWDVIESNTNVTQMVIVSPKIPATYNTTAAVLTYVFNNSQRVGYSSIPISLYIMSNSEYRFYFTSHMFEWFVFILMTILSCAAPYKFWSGTQASNKHDLHSNSNKAAKNHATKH